MQSSNIIPTTRKRRDREEEENTPSTSLTSSSNSTISSYYEEKSNLIENDHFRHHSPSSNREGEGGGGTLTKLARVQADTVHICRQANSVEECMDSLLQGVTLPTSDDNNELDAFSAFNDFMKSKHFLPSVLSLEHSVNLPPVISPAMTEKKATYPIRIRPPNHVEAVPEFDHLRGSLGTVILQAETSELALVITEPFPPFRITYANPAWEKLCEFSVDEALGKNLAMLQGPLTNRMKLRTLLDGVQQGFAGSTTVINYKKSGCAFYNRIRIRPLRGEDGVVTHLLGLARSAGLVPAASLVR